MHGAALETIGMREDSVGFVDVRHVFLNAEIVNTDIKVQGRGHADGTEVGGTMRADADLIKLRQRGDLA